MPDIRPTRDRTEFGQRLLAARKHANLTQAQLGELIGIGQSGISYLESRGMASEQTWQIAHVCGVRTAWLANNEGPMVGPETPLDKAWAVAESEAPAYNLTPNNARDYRTMAHSLADSLAKQGIEVPVRSFLTLLDELYRRFGHE